MRFRPDLQLIPAVLLAFAFLGFALLPTSEAQAPFPVGTTGPAGDCRAIPLTVRPGWTISGAWSNGGTVLLVVDSFNNKILRYSSDGTPLSPLPEPIESAFENFTPSVIKSDGSDLVLELANGRMVRLGRNLAPLSRRDLIRESQRGGESIEGIYQWDLAGGDLLVFGDVHRPQAPEAEQWKSGFFRVPSENPKAFQSLYEIPPADPARIFYRLGSPLIASSGSTGYFLLMEERPRIVRHRKGSAKLEPLRAFPRGLEKRPLLPTWSRLAEYAPLMQQVERSSMPTALFSWEGALYVLSRRFSEGRTEWTISKLNPETDTLAWTTEINLPSSNHVTVVPGPQQWAFIEKGVAKGLFNQEVKSIFLVPASKFRRTPGNDLCR